MVSKMDEKEISIKSFKAFDKKIIIKPNRINIIVGQNSSGKSSLIHFFQLLSNSIASKEANPFSYSPVDPLRKDLISFKNIIFAHDLKRDLEFSFTSFLRRRNSKKNQSGLNLRLEWKSGEVEGGVILIKEFILSIRKEGGKIFREVFKFVPKLQSASATQKHLPQNQYYVESINLNALGPVIFEQEIQRGIEMLTDLNRPDQPSTRKKQQANRPSIEFCEQFIKDNLQFSINGLIIGEAFYLIDKDSKISFPLSVIFRFLDVFQNSFKQYIQDSDFIGPIREQIKPVYPMTSPGVDQSVGYAGHKLGSFLGSRTTLNHINRLLKTLSIPYKIRVENNDDSQMNIIFFENCSQVRLRADSLGTGISQVLPIILGLATMKDGNLFLEQPELHLHPRMHEQLADLIIQETKSNKNESSLFIESHSESLIKGILYYAQKHKFPYEDISIYCVNSLNGSSDLTQVNINENYNIDGGIDWESFPVNGFFGEL